MAGQVSHRTSHLRLQYVSHLRQCYVFFVFWFMWLNQFNLGKLSNWCHICEVKVLIGKSLHSAVILATSPSRQLFQANKIRIVSNFDFVIQFLIGHRNVKTACICQSDLTKKVKVQWLCSESCKPKVRSLAKTNNVVFCFYIYIYT